MRIQHQPLKELVQSIFERNGCRPEEAERVAFYLVESNLVGHDSHGVIRVVDYVRFLKEGLVRANQTLKVVFQNQSMAVADGQSGFGQVMGEKAVRLGIELTRNSGLAAVSLKNSGHLGRIGDWPLLAAQAGLASLHFVNTTGLGLLVAPYGGIDRRLSANPIAAGIPVAGGKPIILDISTSSIAEGKLKVARNRGDLVPPGYIIRSDGQPTRDPKDFYASPPGALLPFGGHKGYGLGVIAEMFAGALSGSGCSDPANNRQLINGMFSIYIDPDKLPRDFVFSDEVHRFIAFVKSSRTHQPNGQILMPGEVEDQTRETRVRDGIELDETTWSTLCEVARSVGVDPESVRPRLV